MFNARAAAGDPTFIKLARDFNTATYGRPGWSKGGARIGPTGTTKRGPARYAKLPQHVPKREGAMASSTDRLASKMAASKKKNWMQGAVKHPGALHRQLGVPANQKIPAARLSAAANSNNALLARRARLAQTFAKFRS
jgi:hypothetical protein